MSDDDEKKMRVYYFHGCFREDEEKEKKGIQRK